MNEQKKLIDYLFWIIIVLYLDPGGHIQEVVSIRIFKTLVIPFTWILFLFGSNLKGFQLIGQDRVMKQICILLVLWYVIYYAGIFVYIRDGYTEISLVGRLIKTRINFLAWTMIVPVYYFIVYRGISVFIKVFTFTTIYVGVAMMISVIFGLELVNFISSSRGYVETDRFLLRGFGILEMGLYLIVGLTIIPKQYFNSGRLWLIAASISTYFIYISSLTRRYMVYIVLSWLIGHFIAKYVFQRGFFNMKIIVVTLLITIGSFIVLSEYTTAIVESFETFTLDQSKSYGTTAVRLSLFEYEPILEKINENPLLGTGYINEWYSNTEEKIEIRYGLEGSDFVFLASIGMFGFLGLILFLPFYFKIGRMIFNHFKLIRNNLKYLEKKPEGFGPYLLIFFTTAVFFIRHLFTYPNWFSFIGPNGVFEKYYILMGLLLGSAYKIYLMLKDNQALTYTEFS